MIRSHRQRLTRPYLRWDVPPRARSPAGSLLGIGQVSLRALAASDPGIYGAAPASDALLAMTPDSDLAILFRPDDRNLAKTPVVPFASLAMGRQLDLRILPSVAPADHPAILLRFAV